MRTLTIVAAVLALCVASLVAADKPPTASAPTTASQPATVNEAHPELASSGLTFARIADLPKGTVLKAGELVITEKQVADAIAKAPKEAQEQLKKNAFFLLEQMATKALLLKEGKIDASKAANEADERAMIQRYLATVSEKVNVSDEEIASFYKDNKDSLGGAELAKVKPQIALFVRQQKQQEAGDQYLKTLGQRTIIEVSAAWAKEQAVLAKDNPVDKARASGKPTVVDFGSTGCRPCEMLAPILKTLKEKYEGKANVVVVMVRDEPILTARYGISAIPVQVFFDKDGKEVSRHAGFWPQDEFEKQMATMGVK